MNYKNNDIVDTLQNVEQSMLVSLKQLLEENNIRFFLAYGTAIGCVRNKGFIPWDDDVDIFILGEDYPRLQKVFDEKDTGFLRLHDYSTVKDYPYVFPKVIDSRTILREKAFDHVHYEGGVYIDVFPLMSLPTNKIKCFFFEKIRYFRYAVVKAAYVDPKNYGHVKKIGISMLKKIFNPLKMQEKLYQSYIRNDDNAIEYIDPLVFDVRLKREWFNNIVYKEFEDSLMPIPEKYDQMLSIYYGDYMTPPPENQRISNHDFSYLKVGDEVLVK